MLLLCTVVSLPLHASDDLGMWFGAGITKKVAKQLSVSVDGEWRLKDNISATDRFVIGASVAYKPMKWLKMEGGYKYLHTRWAAEESAGGGKYYNTYWYPRHRVYAGVEGRMKTARWTFSLRERWVYTYRPEFDRHYMDIDPSSDTFGEISSKARDGAAENVLRSRLAVEYNIRKCPLTPFGSVELYNSWNVEKIRYSVGADYNLSKHQNVKVYYLFQDRKNHSLDDETIDQHVIGVSYGYSF